MIATRNRVLYLGSDDGPADEASVRFRLTYDGPLRSTQPGNVGRAGLAQHKQEIRKSFHQQLAHLWRTNRFLSASVARPVDVRDNPDTGMVDQYAAREINADTFGGAVPLVDAVAWQYRENGYRFVPLVRESLSLLCSLDILFLRRDPPGSVISAGDLDNRIKTLVDAFRRPRNASELVGYETPGEGEDPFFCLLEDDDLVSRLVVETDHLLELPSSNKDEERSQVKLVITVELRPYYVTMANLSFA